MRDLLALRLTCRDGRDVVDQDKPELHLRFRSETRGRQKRPDKRLQKVFGGWAARLRRRQRCTCLRVELCFELRFYSEWPVGLCERLLDLFDAASGNIRELHIDLSMNSEEALELPTTLPERLASKFPSLQDLRLVGKCAPPAPWSFYAGITLHLPRLQRLQICFIEGLNHMSLLAGSLTQLRDLTLSFAQPDEGWNVLWMSPRQVEVLARFPNLHTLRLQGVSATHPSLVHVLRFGLGEALEELEIEGGGVRLTRARMSGDCSSSSSSGQPQQRQKQIRSWDMDVSDRRRLVSVTAAVTGARLRLNRLRVQEAKLEHILGGPLVPYLNILKVDSLRLGYDREVPELGRALQQLTEPPKFLTVSQVKHRPSMAILELRCAPLLARSLQRLDFYRCTGLTPANLVSLLVALPLCEEVEVCSCERLHTGRKYKALVEGLLALPQEAELRSRPLHIHLDRYHLRRRPRESDEGTDVDAEAVPVDNVADVGRVSVLSYLYNDAGAFEDDEEARDGEEEEEEEEEGEGEGGEEEEAEDGEGAEEAELSKMLEDGDVAARVSVGIRY
nr:hypothetical protein PLESTM_001630500 [Pleodorina starrii]